LAPLSERGLFSSGRRLHRGNFYTGPTFLHSDIPLRPGISHEPERFASVGAMHREWPGRLQYHGGP
jgi:hypothetical protein